MPDPIATVRSDHRPAARRIAFLGECMVELSEREPGVFVQGFAGDTYNTAVYLRRLSGSELAVDYATGLGGDAFAADMLRAWQAEGIGSSLVRRIGERSSGLYSIRTDAAGERSFSYWREASAARAYFAAATTPLEAAAAAIDLLYLSGISLAVLAEAGPERLPALLERIRSHGGKVVFDNNFRPRLWPSPSVARAAFERVYAVADIAFVTLDDEAELRPELSPEQLLATVLALPCAEVVVKRGTAPTLVRSEGQTTAVATLPVARVVDTTAAGDSFAAGYLARRLAGADPIAAAAFGNRVAAAVIQHPGAIVPRAAMQPLIDASAARVRNGTPATPR